MVDHVDNRGSHFRGGDHRGCPLRRTQKTSMKIWLIILIVGLLGSAALIYAASRMGQNPKIKGAPGSFKRAVAAADGTIGEEPLEGAETLPGGEYPDWSHTEPDRVAVQQAQPPHLTEDPRR